MAAIDDLKQAVADLQAAVAALHVQRDADLANQQAALQGANNPAMADATAAIRAQVDLLNTERQRVMPAPPEPPQPAPKPRP